MKDVRIVATHLRACVAALLLAGCAATEHPAPPAPPPAPRTVEAPAPRIAATAHPLATRAALEMLERGGSPIDAAIAAQMVLGLVESQSSGIGGGSVLLLWDAGTRTLTSYDGLSAAPARVTAGLTVDADGSALKMDDVRRGGRSVGVPGTLSVLKPAHERFGKLPWPTLFEPAIRVAEKGFPLPPYMHGILSTPTAADEHPDLLPYFFGPDRKVLPVGTRVRNPEYAATTRRIAQKGPAGLLADGGGGRIVAALQRGFRPSFITEADLAAYRATKREAVCGPFLVYSVCVMAPPSFGGIAVLQILQIVEAAATRNTAGRVDLDDPAFVHLYVEAGKLAQADRRKYVGDPAFVAVPTRKLVAPAYLQGRARAIDAARANPEPAAGDVEPKLAHLAPDVSEVNAATSQIAIVDRAGNALSMTTTNNLNFGSRIMVDGFVLNNAMSNFSPAPRGEQVVANRMQPGKRPVTAMAPAIVLDPQGVPVVVGGSAGGGAIVDYIASSLIAMLASGRTPTEALARGHVTSAVPRKLQLEKGTAAEHLAPALAARGHAVEVVPLSSGLGFVARRGEGWIGAADSRRDGAAASR